MQFKMGVLKNTKFGRTHLLQTLQLNGLIITPTYTNLHGRENKDLGGCGNAHSRIIF